MNKYESISLGTKTGIIRPQTVVYVLVLYTIGLIGLVLENYAGIHTFLIFEIFWILVFVVLLIKGSEKLALALLSIPMLIFVELQLVIIILMSVPYIFERFK